MSSPARDLIMQSVFDRFSDIRKSNDYLTDIGRHCFRWKANAWSSHETPGVSLNDVSCTVQGQVSRGHDWTLTVEAVTVAEGPTTPQQLIYAEADIIKAIGVNPRWDVASLEGRTMTSQFSSEIKVDHQEKILGSLRLTFQIQFRTELWNPLI